MVGSFDNPSSTTLFPALAANNGFHVLVLKYPNGTAAQSACGGSSDLNCYLNFRKEILEGINYSTEVNVDAPNSAYNRLIKLLIYLGGTDPSQNWNQFFTGITTSWDKVIISGHSQGGGHAAVIAINKPVKRVLMFASPNDDSVFFNAGASWTTAPHIVADSNYYGFNNTNDDVVNFPEQFEIWSNLGMATFGDSVYVDANTSPYNDTRQLYIKYDTTGLGGNHSVMILDSKTPIDGFGSVRFAPVWEYMLGMDQASASLAIMDHIEEFIIYPNPAYDYAIIKTSNLSLNYQIIVHDLFGREMQVAFTQKADQIILNTLDLTPGAYNVRLTTSNSVIQHKMVVK